MPGMGAPRVRLSATPGTSTILTYLINGRVPTAPTSFSSKPGHRIRIRLINAGADTIFKVALGGHQMTVTHSDGYPVVPRTTRSLYIAMGERYDVIVTDGDGLFPLVADAEGKTGMTNMTAMVHPMHIHGHSWALPASGGLRKDTVLIRPMETIVADFQADNPGDWAFHCHNTDSGHACGLEG